MCRRFCDPVYMRLGLLCGSLALAGCLTSNPALTDSSGDTEGDDSTGGGTSGSPTTHPSTTDGPPSSTATSATGGTTVDPDTTAGPDTDETETTGPAACGAGNVCAPEVPAGWAGPVVWAETATEDPQPACPEAYAELAFNAFDDLQAPPAECACECGEAKGASCAPLTLELHGTDSSCSGAPDDTFTIVGTSCNNGPDALSGRYWEVTDPGVSSGSCAPIDSVQVSSAGFSHTSTVCGGAAVGDGECVGAQTCVTAPPEGFESRLCVWQEGDLECPAGGYEDRFVRHADFDDDRSCTTCTCGGPTGSCSGAVILWSGSNCTQSAQPGPAGNIDIDGGCQRALTSSSYPVTAAEAGSLSVEDASCAPSGGVPVGEAEPDDPYTLCCLSIGS